MGGSKRFFRQSLITVLLITSLPGLLIGVGVYFAGTGQIAGELNAIHQQQLRQAQKSIDDQLIALEMSLSHWAFDPQFDEKLRRLDPIYGYSQVQDIYRTLLVMRELNPLILRVKLYLEEPVPLLFTEEGYERIPPDRLGVYHEQLAHKTSARWITDSPDAISLVHLIPGGSPRPFGAFLVTVDPARLTNMITLLTPQGEGTSFLIGENGEWLAPAARSGRTIELEEALRAKVVQDGGSGASFRFDWDGETYSVSYGTLSRLGTQWLYVSATPIQSVTQPVVFISRLIVAISGLGLLLAAVLSWFASRRLYRPVARLVTLLGGKHQSRIEGKDEFEMIEQVWNHVTRESQQLQARLEKQLPQVREGFLLQLLQGYLGHLSEHDLRDRMENLGYEVEGSRFAILFIQLLGFSSLEGRFAEGDEVLVTFAAANIVKELAENEMEEADAINFHDLTVGLLIGSSSEEPLSEWKTRVDRLLNEIVERLNQFLHMRVVIGMGGPVRRMKDIPGRLEEARHAVRFRDVREDNQIIAPDELDGLAARPPVYPFHLEKEVVQAIRMAAEDEALAAVLRFLDELRDQAGKELWVQQGMLHLLGSVQNAMMQMGTNLHELYDGANLYEQLCQIREPDEIGKWFASRVISPFMREMRRRQDLLLHQLIENVLRTINERYMEDISLDAIADSHRLSSYALSRAFKQITGVNFIDLLTETRLEQAKRLLRETDLKLHEVAERVGYQQTYFGRIFKKNTGVTPSRYRESVREQGRE